MKNWGKLLPHDDTTIEVCFKLHDTEKEFLDMLRAETNDELVYNDIVLNNLQCNITRDIVEYIAVFIVRKIKKINCFECEGALFSSCSSALIDIKLRGFLIKPSQDVIIIAELVFKSNINIMKQNYNPIISLIIKAFF